MVECGGLENRLARNPGHGGSNPPSSARLHAAGTGNRACFSFCKPVLTNGLFHLSRPDAACRAGGQADFQSSLAYQSTLRSSFKPPSLASAALAFLGANGPPKRHPACHLVNARSV